MEQSEKLQKETLESLYPEYFNQKVENAQSNIQNEEDDLEHYKESQALQVHEWM